MRKANPVAGDILAVVGSSFFSRLIILATGGPVSHVGLILTDDPPLVLEALSRVMTRPLHVSIEKAQAAYLLKPINLTWKDRVGIVECACTMSAESYGYGKILLQLFDAVARTTWFTKYLTFTTMPICSWAVARAYGSKHLHFGVPDNSATPSDIYRFATAHPTLYSITRLK